MRLRIYSWPMIYLPPKLASAGIIASDVGRRQQAQDDPTTYRLTSSAQASTSGRCEADLARLKEDTASMMKTKLGVDMSSSRLYQKPYATEFDLVSYHTGWCVPNFVKFSGDDKRTSWENIS